MAKWFVQKIPLNKIYSMDNVYLFYPPDAPTTEALRQEAAEINARKLTKIMDLQDQIKELQRNLPDME